MLCSCMQLSKPHAWTQTGKTMQINSNKCSKNNFFSQSVSSVIAHCDYTLIVNQDILNFHFYVLCVLMAIYHLKAIILMAPNKPNSLHRV